jgi:hypothetical protein
MPGIPGAPASPGMPGMGLPIGMFWPETDTFTSMPSLPFEALSLPLLAV